MMKHHSSRQAECRGELINGDKGNQLCEVSQLKLAHLQHWANDRIIVWIESVAINGNYSVGVALVS